MRKALLWLGLGPDDAYEEYGTESWVNQGPLTSGEFVEARAAADNTGNVHQLRATDESSTSVRALPMEPSGTVRPLQPAVAVKPHTVSPASFNDAPELADRFMASQPVIVNLQGVDGKVARRIIDFASGLCYGKEGQMERVTSQVYLLTPSDVEVSAEDRRRLEDSGS
ncbi:MAG: cell division protein SepF [Actinobacteria bacterium]|nr:cell division protein SepF [Actinomycetota bacterium]